MLKYYIISAICENSTQNVAEDPIIVQLKSKY